MSWTDALVIPVAAIGLVTAASLSFSALTTSTTHSIESMSTELVEPALPQKNTLYAANGQIIAEVYAYNRQLVAYTDISAPMKQAILSAEDRRFFQHNGIDPEGTARSLVSTLGGSLQGGSTITQQYVKNVELLEADFRQDEEGIQQAIEPTLDRKFRQAKQALWVEGNYSKEQILEKYLNSVYFGNGAYGIEAAAQTYYGISANKLDYNQSATLAGIVNAPARFDPIANPKDAKKRRNEVLQTLVETGNIPQSLANTLKTRPLNLAVNFPKAGCAAAKSGWEMYCDAVMRTLQKTNILSSSPKKRTKILALGGLEIHTALKPTVQNAAVEAERSTIPAKNRVASAIAVVSPQTGDVAALATNRYWGKGKGRTSLPLATESRFSPGSTFKAITLTSALEQKVPLNTTLQGGSPYYSSLFKNPPGGWNNMEGSVTGPVNIRTATEKSLNTAYIQIQEKAGVLNVADAGRRLGLTGLPESGPNPVTAKEGSLTLGAREQTVLDMATVYATLANSGQKCGPNLITSISGAQTWTKPPCTKAVAAPVADTVTAVLKGAYQRGTAAPAKIIQQGTVRPAAAKTGTAEDLGAAWLAGYTDKYATVVWVGDPRGPTHSLINVLGYPKVYGGTLPATIWRKTMTDITADTPFVNLPEVDYTYMETEVPQTGTTLPDVVGLPVQTAIDRLKSVAGANVEIQTVYGNRKDVKAGTVIAQDPPQTWRYSQPIILTIQG